MLAMHEKDSARTALAEIHSCQEGKILPELDKSARQIRCGGNIITLTLQGYDWDTAHADAEAIIAKPALTSSNAEGLIIPAIIFLGLGGVIGNMADIRNETAEENVAVMPRVLKA